MPRTSLSRLHDDARLWVFGISPALDAAQQQRLLERIDPFLDSWTAHGTPILSARDVLHGSFLAIAVERTAETSGCSIDRLYGTLQQLERDLGVTILDPQRIFFRHGDGRIDAMSRPEFRERADRHTLVFDTTVDELGAVRRGSWEKPAHESWHGKLLKAS